MDAYPQLQGAMLHADSQKFALVLLISAEAIAAFSFSAAGWMLRLLKMVERLAATAATLLMMTELGANSLSYASPLLYLLGCHQIARYEGSRNSPPEP